MQQTDAVNNAAAASEDQIQAKLIAEARKKEKLTEILPYIGILFLIAVFGAATKGKFLGVDNLALLLNQCFTMIIIMTGAIFIYGMGSMDMAIGQVLALDSLALTLLYNSGWPLAVSVLAGMAVAVLFMGVTAFAKNYLGISPFIASLCVANVASGIVVAYCKGSKVIFPYSRAPWLNNSVTKILVLAAILVIGYILFNFTPLGKSVKCIGGSPVVSRISGIKVEKTNFLAYLTMAVCIGIAAVFTVARGGAVDPSTGSSTNLNVMIGIVLGGFPLHGGANARFASPIIGALMVAILTNGLGMLGQANSVGYALKALLFLIVVAITYEKSLGKLVN